MPPVSIRNVLWPESSSFAAHDSHTFTFVYVCTPVLCAIFTRNLLFAFSVCVYVCARMYVHTYVCMYICMCTYECIMYVRVKLCVCVLLVAAQMRYTYVRVVIYRSHLCVLFGENRDRRKSHGGIEPSCRNTFLDDRMVVKRWLKEISRVPDSDCPFLFHAEPLRAREIDKSM